MRTLNKYIKQICFSLQNEVYLSLQGSLLKIKRIVIGRVIVSLLFFGILLIRSANTAFKFDDLSFRLLVGGCLVILIPDLKDLVSRIKKVSWGDKVFEFNQETKARLEDAVVELEDLPLKPSIEKLEENEKFLEHLGWQQDPLEAFRVLTEDIEESVMRLSISKGLKVDRSSQPEYLLTKLAQMNVVPLEIMKVFRSFWDVRNRVIYHLDYAENFSWREMNDLMGLGLAVKSLLPDRNFHEEIEPPLSNMSKVQSSSLVKRRKKP